MTTITFVAWLLMMALTLLWLALCQRLFADLKNPHPQSFAALGSPHLIFNNTPRHSVLLLRFVFGNAGREIPDPALQRFLRFLRILFVAILFLYVAFICLFFVAPPS